MRGLSVIVVSWNCAPFILRFISELNESLREVSDFEVLVLDNNSSDGTPDLLEKYLPANFKLIRSQVNLGFSKGNNRLIRQAIFDNIVLLNPDVFNYPEGFWSQVEVGMRSECADVAFVKLRNADGTYQDCIGSFPSPSRAFCRLVGWSTDFSNIKSPTVVEVGIMAFLATTRKVFDEVGLIDEDFHMYCEDVEWCYRAREKGKRVVYFPGIELTHIGGASSSSRWTNYSKVKMKLQSERLFINKSYKGVKQMASIVLLDVKMAYNFAQNILSSLRKA